MGGVSSIQVYFGFLEFFNFAKPLPASIKKPVTGVTGHGGLFLLVGVPSQRFPVEGLLASHHGLQFFYPQAKSQVEEIYANHFSTVDKNGSYAM